MVFLFRSQLDFAQTIIIIHLELQMLMRMVIINLAALVFFYILIPKIIKCNECEFMRVATNMVFPD